MVKKERCLHNVKLRYKDWTVLLVLFIFGGWGRKVLLGGPYFTWGGGYNHPLFSVVKNTVIFFFFCGRKKYGKFFLFFSRKKYGKFFFFFSVVKKMKRKTHMFFNGFWKKKWEKLMFFNSFSKIHTKFLTKYLREFFEMTGGGEETPFSSNNWQRKTKKFLTKFLKAFFKMIGGEDPPLTPGNI